jgi:hypothetical protein
VRPEDLAQLTHTLEAWVQLLRAWAADYGDDTPRIIAAGVLRRLADDLEATRRALERGTP